MRKEYIDDIEDCYRNLIRNSSLSVRARSVLMWAWRNRGVNTWAALMSQRDVLQTIPRCGPVVERELAAWISANSGGSIDVSFFSAESFWI